jgi:hypothetical protein
VSTYSSRTINQTRMSAGTVVTALTNRSTELYQDVDDDKEDTSNEILALYKTKKQPGIIVSIAGTMVNHHTDYTKWCQEPEFFHQDLKDLVTKLSEKNLDYPSFMSWISIAIWFLTNVAACSGNVDKQSLLWGNFFEKFMEYGLQCLPRDVDARKVQDMQSISRKFFKLLDGPLLEQPDYDEKNADACVTRYRNNALYHCQTFEKELVKVATNERVEVKVLEDSEVRTACESLFGKYDLIMNYLEGVVTVVVTSSATRDGLDQVLNRFLNAFEKEVVKKERIEKALLIHEEFKEDPSRHDILFYVSFSPDHPLISQVRVSYRSQGGRTLADHSGMKSFLRSKFPAPSQASTDFDTEEKAMRYYMDRAKSLEKGFAQTLRNIEPKATVSLKGAERIKEKTRQDYNGDYSRVCDYLRGTVHIPLDTGSQPNDLLAIYKDILGRFSGKVLRQKLVNDDQHPRTLLNLVIGDDEKSQMVCEVQVHLQMAGFDDDFLDFLHNVYELKREEKHFVDRKANVEEQLIELLARCGLNVDRSFWSDIIRPNADFSIQLLKLDSSLLKLKAVRSEVINKETRRKTRELYFKLQEVEFRDARRFVVKELVEKES